MNEDIQVQVAEPIQTVIQKLEGWLNSFISLIPNMAVTLLLLIIFLVLARLGSKLFKKLFSKASNNKALEHLFSTVIYVAILGIGLFIMLGVLGLNKAVTSLLAGIGVIGLALGFAFQDIAANFVSGIILAFRRPFKRGDIIETKDIMGKVTKTNLRDTVIETFQGQEVYIPNKDFLQNAFYNFSVLERRRVDLAVGVSYAEDLEKVEDVVLSAIKNLEGVIDKDKIVFDYSEFDSSSINFNIRFWIEYPDQPGYLTMRSKAIKAIKRAFDEQDITIPFPIRTLDFGIKGGQKLSQMELNK
ncbi:MAG: mechanosensitive ion channel family protein [Bacteroidia bacterium]|nr:mechanosensitive ion channel family protein [Bacteroidia bacterium]